MKKGLLYLSIFLVMAALACKGSVESPDPAGVWEKSSDHLVLGTIELKENSHFFFKATSEGHTDSKGKYSISENNQITFEDDTCYAPGTYEYNIDGNQLSMAVVRDNCEQRANTLSGIWTLKQ